MSAEARLRITGQMGTSGNLDLDVEGAQLYMVRGQILEAYVELRIDEPVHTVSMHPREARYLAVLLNAAADVAER